MMKISFCTGKKEDILDVKGWSGAVEYVKTGREGTHIEGYQMANTCSYTHKRTHSCILPLQSNRHWAFLPLMHHFLFSGYPVLIYSPSYDGTGPPHQQYPSSSHTACTLSVPLFVISLLLHFCIFAPSLLLITFSSFFSLFSSPYTLPVSQSSCPLTTSACPSYFSIFDYFFSS